MTTSETYEYLLLQFRLRTVVNCMTHAVRMPKHHTHHTQHTKCSHRLSPIILGSLRKHDSDIKDVEAFK